MVDRTHTGCRCRTVQHISTHDGFLRRDTYGTIEYEVENLGRRLVFVQWDNGMKVAVFSGEIEIDNNHLHVDVAA
jgi:hypothetical protein